MKTENAGPRIPIPWSARWRQARMRIVPVIVFGSVVFSIAYLWKDHIAAPTMVGQAEPVLANVSCYRAGVLAELTVNRFQSVKAGDAVGQVLVTDPRVLASSLAVIQAEIELLRSGTGLKPTLSQERAAVSSDQLRLNWMRDRAQLATARVSLQLAETDLHRNEELLKDKIIAQRVYDQAKATRDRYQNEVEELTKLVSEGERSIKQTRTRDDAQASVISGDDPMRAAIAVQESKLRLTEAELSPIVLKAPIDGIVSTIYHRAGEAVTAGQPVVAVATHNPVRIVGYLRPPIMQEPVAGMPVQVRTRGSQRQTGMAAVVQVGSQLEALPATMISPVRIATTELGLPIDISIPANIKIRPGELVDLIFMGKASN